MIRNVELAFSDVSVKYPNAKTPAVVGASLKLTTGRVHALIGESGSGKTTVASVINGMLPLGTKVCGQAVVSTEGGSIDLTQPSWRWGAQRWTSKKVNILRGRLVGYVPQTVTGFLTPVRHIGKQLSQTCALHENRHAPDELLDIVGLEHDVLSMYPHQLSGGMAQRLAVAFSLAGDPGIIIADEPTSALDASRADVIFSLFREYATRGGTVLIVTHAIRDLLRYDVIDDLSVMCDGQIVEQGLAKPVLHAPSHPYTQALLKSLPINGLHPIPEELRHIDRNGIDMTSREQK